MSKSDKTFIFLENLGINPNFFMKNNQEKQKVFIQKETIRKIYSENAVCRLDDHEEFGEEIKLNQKRCRTDDDFLYGHNEDEEFSNKTFGDKFIDVESDLYDDEPVVKPEAIKKKERQSFANNNWATIQINKLSDLVKEIQNEEKIRIKAYKSNLKSKFFKIYEENSEKLKEKTKLKTFHRCNFPNCHRTFASSGWLKSHFKEHLNDLEKDEFNAMFEDLLRRYKLLKLIK